MRSGLADGVAHALEHFAAALRERFGSRVSEVVLFGSHARGEAHELTAREEIAAAHTFVGAVMTILARDGWLPGNAVDAAGE